MKKIKPQHVRSIVSYFFLSLAVVFLLCLGICVLDNLMWPSFSEMLFGSVDEAREMVTDFFLVEIQISFIVVSLGTVLSSSSKNVYWVDSFKYRLERPRFSSFIALSSYILATLFAGAIWLIIDRLSQTYAGIMGVFVSFALSIILLAALSMRIIGANFGREKIKEDLEKSLIKTRKEKLQISYRIGSEVGRRIPEINQLLQITVCEIDDREFDLVVENMTLLVKMGFMEDFKRLYRYAANTLQDEGIMDLITSSIMEWAVRNKEDRMFYSNCPIPFETQSHWWKELIESRFDEAVVLWLSGKKNNMNKAMEIRKDLFAMITKVLGYQYVHRMHEISMDCGDESDIDLFKYRLVEIMARFADRRETHIFIHGEDFDLSEEWTQKEDDVITDDIEAGWLRDLRALAEEASAEWAENEPDFDEYNIMAIENAAEY